MDNVYGNYEVISELLSSFEYISIDVNYLQKQTGENSQTCGHSCLPVATAPPPSPPGNNPSG